MQETKLYKVLYVNTHDKDPKKTMVDIKELKSGNPDTKYLYARELVRSKLFPNKVENIGEQLTTGKIRKSKVLLKNFSKWEWINNRCIAESTFKKFRKRRN